MAKKNRKYIIKTTYKAFEERTEIDFDLYNELGIGDEDEQVKTITNANTYQPPASFCSIKIDKVLDVLKQFKNKNCEYIDIMYHEDHIGYYFYGSNIKAIFEKEPEYKKIMAKNVKEHDIQILENIKFHEQQIIKLKKDLKD